MKRCRRNFFFMCVYKNKILKREAGCLLQAEEDGGQRKMLPEKNAWLLLLFICLVVSG